MNKIELIVPTLFGLEGLAGDELRRMGMENVRVEDRRVVNTAGEDVTKEFELGAELALQVAKEYGCTLAILKERSPSCGCHGIYDGTFSKKIVDGMGKAAELLTANGIRVIGESEL